MVTPQQQNELEYTEAIDSQEPSSLTEENKEVEYRGLLRGFGSKLFITAILYITAWSIQYSEAHESPTPQALDFTTPPFYAFGLLLLSTALITLYNDRIGKSEIEQ